MNTALSAVNTCGVEIDWDLERFHLVFSITTAAVCEYSWDSVSLQNFEETLTRFGSHSSRNAIRWYSINPNETVIDFDTTSFDSRSQYICSKAL